MFFISSLLLFTEQLKKVVEGNKPEISKGLEDSSLIEGDDLRLVAKVQGTPLPEVHWMKDGKALSEDRRTKMVHVGTDEWVLSIKDVTERDSGKFSLEAKNSFGKDESTAKIIIASPTPKRYFFL